MSTKTDEEIWMAYAVALLPVWPKPDPLSMSMLDIVDDLLEGHRERFPAVEEPKPSNKIPWSGGECPVPPETKVRCYLRSGDLWEAEARECNWTRFCEIRADTGWHIVAYEVLT
jgi:hypothetical protein